MHNNGEAIYGTRPLSNRWQDPTTAEIRYTQKNGTIYAIYLDYGGDKFWGSPSHTLACVTPSAHSTTATLLGYTDDSTREPIPLKWSTDGGMTVVIPQPPGDPDSIPPPGFTIKIEGATVAKGC
mmetsp:Transcript_2287/g.5574  ORF Transcript_2287/g.5574 Transcript_2287/m.5574 type:complete len:124 (+) Transcript_2287:3-374(+)